MSVLSDLVRERRDWVSSHSTERKGQSNHKLEWALLAGLWIMAFIILFAGVPHSVQTIVGATVDYVRGIGMTVVGLFS